MTEDYQQPDQREHPQTRTKPTAEPPLAPAPGSALPDIGEDPLKASDLQLSTALCRLGKARDIQQEGVPDQTALVWRIDLMRVMDELTLMTARWNLMRQREERLEDEANELRAKLEQNTKVSDE